MVTWMTCSPTSWALDKVSARENKVWGVLSGIYGGQFKGSFIMFVNCLHCLGVVVCPVHNVRHLYTEWEENPDKIILRSKSFTTFLPLSSASFTLIPSEETTPPPTRDPSHPVDEYCSLGPESLKTALQGNAGGFLSAGESADSAGSGRGKGACQKSVVKHADSGFISVQESSSSGGSSHEDDATSLAVSHGNHYRKHKPAVTRLSKKQLLQERDEEKMIKYSPEQLKVIQARVKDSLKNQGVYLYDPITGAGDTQLISMLHWLLW